MGYRKLRTHDEVLGRMGRPAPFQNSYLRIGRKSVTSAARQEAASQWWTGVLLSGKLLDHGTPDVDYRGELPWPDEVDKEVLFSLYAAAVDPGLVVKNTQFPHLFRLVAGSYELARRKVVVVKGGLSQGGDLRLWRSFVQVRHFRLALP